MRAVLEIQVQSTFCHTKDRGRDRSLEKARWHVTIACGEPSVCGANDASWIFTSAYRTIQKDMRSVRQASPRGQKWSTFLHSHAEQIWACDASPGRLPFSSIRCSPSTSSNCTRARVIY